MNKQTTDGSDWRARRQKYLEREPQDVPAPRIAEHRRFNTSVMTDITLQAQAYREELIARMPDSSQMIIRRLEKVRAVYVECARDRKLDAMLTEFHQLILTQEVDGTAPGGVFFITGESGAGKTAAIREMLRRSPVLKPIEHSFGTSRPYVSVSLKGETTLNLLGRRIMSEGGYTVKQSRQSEIWDQLSRWLLSRRIHLIHIDETQHLMRKTEKDVRRKSLADALKGLMNDAEWPVSFILSGLPEVSELARLDEQFERRCKMIKLTDVEEDERDLIENIIVSMADAAELEYRTLITSDVPERIAHAVRHRYGRICQAVLAAIHVALQADAKSLERDHFAHAAVRNSHAYGHDDHNVFLVDDWWRLEPGSFILNEGAGQ